MNFLLLFILTLSSSIAVNGQDNTQSLTTAFSLNLQENNILSEYPRPNMVREKWKSLNGIWNYSIISDDQNIESQGQILVPFPIESKLSGIEKKLSEDHILIYEKEFIVPKDWTGQNILLHFEAVDWWTKVFLNDQLIGEHKGGYDPFQFEISSFLRQEKTQVLKVKVQDPTNKGSQPVGKQTLNPKGIFYTSNSGIWQSVWIEPVSQTYIKNYCVKTNIDSELVNLKVNVENIKPNTELQITLKSDLDTIGYLQKDYTNEINFQIDNPRLWSPDSPFLYDLEINLIEQNKTLDNISGYFGMRKISLSSSHKGQPQILLNNEFVFQNGVLDQGYWPEGIYTPPTDEALKSDIQLAKDLGFNMLRKHVKVESRRFYYWCDVLGILVWQDMPSGGEKIGNEDDDLILDKEVSTQFENELKAMIETHINSPSIVMWIPFNEGWGQYDTRRIVDFVRSIDSTRLISNASGWVDRNYGDIYDIHPYPEPQLPAFQQDRAIVIGEFGGISLPVKGHTWSDESWGYLSYENSHSFLNEYEKYYTQVWNYANNNGLSAVVYTQLTDVESETNGLITYDRKVLKTTKESLYNINTKQYIPKPIIQHSGSLFNAGDEITITNSHEGEIRYTLDGTEPTRNSHLYQKPITLMHSLTMKAKVFGDTLMSRTDSLQFKLTDIPRPQYTNVYQKYTAGGDFGLIDGEKGSIHFNDGKWQGFYGTDTEITISLDQKTDISGISVNFLEDTKSWILLPDTVEFLVSENGIDFELIKSASPKQPQEHAAANICTINNSAKNKDILYIKVLIKTSGRCPEWHEGKNKQSWVFIDEISWSEI